MANFTVSNKHRKNKDRNLIPGQQFWVLAGEKEMRGNRLLRILIILIAVLPDKQSIEIGWNNLEKSTANANVRAFFSPINNNSNKSHFSHILTHNILVSEEKLTQNSKEIQKEIRLIV